MVTILEPGLIELLPSVSREAVMTATLPCHSAILYGAESTYSRGTCEIPDSEDNTPPA
jgi:hypothetical protein